MFDEGSQIQALAATAMAGSALASTVSMSSPNGIWQSVNTIQLYMMILLLGVYIPPKIEYMITS
jgi:hypothetical protein